MSSVGIDPAAALARAPEVLVPGDGFTLPELHAMRLDGVLARVYGQAFRPVNTPETPGLRAAALAAELPPALANRAAIGRMAAAWVYGCAPPPPRIALLVSSRHRSTAAPPFSGCAVHEVALDPLDVLRLGGALVS
ncbi:hypothetical protein [Specibacter sp. RAF43]|uniref:hypothetical protein n=1 Tax=Specibacter sp. RAF43 TaxID=3233057 RepID=UPI003F9C1AB9